MNNIKAQVSTIAAALLMGVVGTAQAKGDVYYPENPNPSKPAPQGNTTINNKPEIVNAPVNAPVIKPEIVNAPVNAPVIAPVIKPEIVNAPVNAPVATAGAEAEAAAAAQAAAEQQQRQQQQQLQQQQNRQTQNTDLDQQNAQILNLQQKFEASKMASLGTISVVPAANCGTGWGAQLSVPNFATGFGKSDISKFCLGHDAVALAYKGGIITQDKGVQALALKAFTKMYPEFLGAAAKDMIPVLKASCFKAAGDISVALLLDEDLQCDGEYVAGTREIAELAQRREQERQQAFAAAAAAQRENKPADQGPLKVQIVGGSVTVDGVVKTKEQYTPRKGPPAKKAPTEVVIIENRDKCATCPTPALK